MAVQSRFPNINPRLRTFYAIFTSTVFATLMTVIILEELQVEKFWLSSVAAGVPLLFALFIGLVTGTRESGDFFISGARVPATFNGFALAITSLGGTGLLTLAGTFYFIGFDGLAMALGWGGAFVFMAVMFSPFMRKVGGYTVPDFFALRFDNRLIRVVIALLLILPALLILSAELKIACFAAAYIIDLPADILILLSTALASGPILLGGMRSLTWSQCAYFIIVLIGFLLPLGTFAISITNLPFPQLTYGTLLDDLLRLELINGLSATAPVGLRQSLQGTGYQLLAKPFLQSFGALSRIDFLLLGFCFMAGLACQPSLLIRASTATNVYEARRALGWGLLLTALILISVPAYAVFAKYITLKELIGVPFDQLPGWAQSLSDLGFIKFADYDRNNYLTTGEVFILRDGILLAFPIMAGLPFVFIVFTIIAVIAAALGAVSAHLVTIANMIAHDIFGALTPPQDNPQIKLNIARLMIALTASMGAWIAITQDFDVLQMFAWAISLSGSTLFAPLIFSIWWKNFTSWGALAGMAAGFVTTLGYIISVEMGGTPILLGVETLIAAALGVPISFLAAIIATRFSHPPAQNIFDLVDDMRSLEGETLSERTQRMRKL